jgi:hypothetical protein
MVPRIHIKASSWVGASDLVSSSNAGSGGDDEGVMEALGRFKGGGEREERLRRWLEGSRTIN